MPDPPVKSLKRSVFRIWLLFETQINSTVPNKSLVYFSCDFCYCFLVCNSNYRETLLLELMHTHISQRKNYLDFIMTMLCASLCRLFTLFLARSKVSYVNVEILWKQHVATIRRKRDKREFIYPGEGRLMTVFYYYIPLFYDSITDCVRRRKLN